MNFVIVWYWALVAMVFLVFVYIYIDFRQVPLSSNSSINYSYQLFDSLLEFAAFKMVLISCGVRILEGRGCDVYISPDSINL